MTSERLAVESLFFSKQLLQHVVDLQGFVQTTQTFLDKPGDNV